MSKGGNHIRLTELDNSVVVLKDVQIPRSFYERILTNVKAIDEIFGGEQTPGLMKGTSILITGTPGAGKSTFALQMAELLQEVAQRNVMYNIGEESDKMLKFNADRLNLKGSFTVGKFEQVDDLIEYCTENGVEVLFQDSLQSLLDSDLRGNNKLRSVAKKLHSFSKSSGTVVAVVGHSVKGGAFAGPQEIAHDVDAHAHFRMNKETGNRILEMEKNRLGPAKMPYEFYLSAHGLEFQMAPDQIGKGEDDAPKPKAADRRDSIVTLIKGKLMQGEEISGYDFERFAVDCSGGMWRVMLMRACEQLKREGFKIGEKKISGRAHNFIEV